MKRALITGITGQDGSYLAELLLDKGYEVHGIVRRASSPNTGRIDHIINEPCLTLHYGDVTDTTNVLGILDKVMPHEVYNLAAQSHVKVSFEVPEYTANADAVGSLRLLEGIKTLGLHTTRFYQASTSELYGNSGGYLRNETTPFKPRSPYAAAKLYAYWITVNYREAYGLHASNGILFNHESPRRGETFVTRKITKAVAAIVSGKQTEPLMLGNLDALRDWGHAKDYVVGMHLALQMPLPGDYVLATGEAHSVREFVDLAFAHAGVNIGWRGQGVSEEAYDLLTGNILVRIDPEFFRPTEVDILRGDATKAMNLLGWRPKVAFQQLVAEMVEADMKS